MKTIKIDRIRSLIPLAILLTVAGLTGCSTFNGSKSPMFGLQIESAAGAFEDRAPGSAPALKELPEMTPAEHERLGDIAFSRKDLSKALIEYEKCLKAEPKNKRVIYKKGLVFLAGDVDDQAATVFQTLTAEAPEYAIAYEGLGRAFYQMKELEKSEAAFKRAVALDIRLWKSHNYLGMIYATHGQHDLAVDAYISAIAENPNQAAVYNNLGVSYYRSGNYLEAIDAFGKAIENCTDESRIYNNLGMALAKSGDYEKALAAFSRAGGKSKAYNNLGCIYLSESKYDRAVTCFEKALDTSPVFYEEASLNLKQAKAGLHNASLQGMLRKESGGENETNGS